MNKHEERCKLLVKLTKCGDFWRMETSDYLKFINYIKNYFRECVCIPEAMFGNVLYADLSEDDLKVIGSYYGIYSPDVNTILLAEVYSDPLILPITNLFTIRLCVRSNSENLMIISTKMLFK